MTSPISVAALEQAARQATSWSEAITEGPDEFWGEYTRLVTGQSYGSPDGPAVFADATAAAFLALASPSTLLALVEATRAADEALRAWQSMPDAGFKDTDPRWDWWHRTFIHRQALHEALGRFSFTDGSEA